MVNQSFLTGESLPVSKRPGMAVYAGTVVEEGCCVLQVEKQQGASHYNKIVEMVQHVRTAEIVHTSGGYVRQAGLFVSIKCLLCFFNIPINFPEACAFAGFIFHKSPHVLRRITQKKPNPIGGNPFAPADGSSVRLVSGQSTGPPFLVLPGSTGSSG